jgi:hypothetical protein
LTIKNRTTGIPFVYQIHDDGKRATITLPTTDKALPIGLNHISIQATLVGQKTSETIG